MFAKAFAARGFVGIAPDYRVRTAPDADPTGTIQDIVSDGRAALAWTGEHAAQYGIDPRRIVLAGGSAGGMLVLNLAHTAPGPLEGVLGITRFVGHACWAMAPLRAHPPGKPGHIDRARHGG